MSATKKKTAASGKATGKKKVSAEKSAEEVKTVKDEDIGLPPKAEALSRIQIDLSHKVEVTENDAKQLANELKNGKTLGDALFHFCYLRNTFFDGSVAAKCVRTAEGEFAGKEGIEQQECAEVLGLYLWIIRNTPKYEGRTFFSQLKKDNFEKVYSEDLSLLELSDEDKKNRQQVMAIMGRDPFADEAPEDKTQMYRDLTGLLSEGMRRDVAKQHAAVEIVRNYVSIGKYQKKVSILSAQDYIDSDTQKELEALLTLISKVQASINQTAKDNGFSGSKAIGTNGKGMLSDVETQVEDRGYDAGITNFYDIETSKAIGQVSDISFRSMLNQVKLSRTDYSDILTQQAEIVRKSQRMAADAMEALRVAKEKITKQQLLDELEKEYRKKGISEDEINEFINAEYDLKDSAY